jgi:flagellar hook-length control protein FliK
MSAAPAVALPVPASPPGVASARPTAGGASDAPGFESWLDAEAPIDAAAEPAAEVVEPLAEPDAAVQADPAVPPAASTAPVPAPPPAPSLLMGAVLQALSVREASASIAEASDAAIAAPGGAASKGAPETGVPWTTDVRRLQALQSAVAERLPGANAGTNPPSAAPLPTGASLAVASALATAVAAVPLPAEPKIEALPDAALERPLLESGNERAAPAAPGPRPVSLPAATALAATSAQAPTDLADTPLPEALAPLAADAKGEGASAPLRGTEVAPPAAGTGLASAIAFATAVPSPSTTAMRRADGALAPVQAPLDSPQWGNEFASRVVAMVREDLSEAEIHVNPQELGPIEVKIRIEGDRLHAQFGAVSPEAREALSANLHRLRELLAGDGLNLGQTFVGHHGAGHSGERGSNAPQAWPQGVPGDGSPDEDVVVLRPARGDRNALLDEFA